MSAQQRIYKVEELNIKSVKLSDIKKYTKTSMSFVNYNGDKLLIALPKMFSPFGASSFNEAEDKKVGNPPKFAVQLSLDTKDKTIAQLRTFLQKLDNLILTTASKNKKWQSAVGYKNKKNKPSSDVRDDLEENKYHTIVKASNNDYPDLIKANVPVDNKSKEISLVLYDTNKDKVNVDRDNITTLLPKLTQMKSLIQISHVWFVSGKFGVIVKILQALPVPKKTITGFACLEDTDDEGEEEEESDEEEEEEELETDDEGEDSDDE